VLSARALGVVGTIVCGQVLFGLLALAALFAARRRASKRTVIQIALIIGFVESFIIAIGLAAANAARGGSDAVTAGLLWYAGGGWRSYRSSSSSGSCGCGCSEGGQDGPNACSRLSCARSASAPTGRLTAAHGRP